MSVLDDMHEFMENRALELERENVNSFRYWVARMGLEEDELNEYFAKQVHSIYEHGVANRKTTKQALFVAIVAGFNLGFVFANREELLAEDAS